MLPPGVRRRLGAARRRLVGTKPPQPPDADEQWFRDHYGMAAGEIAQFLGDSGVLLEGRVVADVGCGDGIMALGVAHGSRPASLVGFDVNEVDVDLLLERARRYGVAELLPPGVEFTRSSSTVIPAENASFDVVYTWSAFEHVGDPEALLREIRRILRPDGALFLQLWPFYYSARGSHLWDWFPEPFHHLVQSEEEIVAAMRASDRHPPEFTEYMLGEFLALNRVTLDELQRCIRAANLEIRKVHLLAENWPVPAEVGSRPLSELGVSGVKLLATPGAAPSAGDGRARRRRTRDRKQLDARDAEPRERTIPQLRRDVERVRDQLDLHDGEARTPERLLEFLERDAVQRGDFGQAPFDPISFLRAASDLGSELVERPAQVREAAVVPVPEVGPVLRVVERPQLEEEHPGGPQNAADLAQQRNGLVDVLERRPRDDEVEGVVGGGNARRLRPLEGQVRRKLLRDSLGACAVEQVLGVRVDVVSHEPRGIRLVHEPEVDDPVSAADVRHVTSFEREAVATEERDDRVRRLAVVAPEPLGGLTPGPVARVRIAWPPAAPRPRLARRLGRHAASIDIVGSPTRP